jgi:FAD:protein FMN transferase
LTQWYPTGCFVRTSLIQLLLLGSFWAGDCALPAAPSPEPPGLFQYALPRMGTQFRVMLYHSDRLQAQKSALAALDRVEDLEDIFSDYRERSEVNRLCLTAVGQPWRISPELYLVLDTSLRISQLSGGAFDVTVGPVVQLWRQARRGGRLPDPEELKKARRNVGYTNIVLDPGAKTALVKLPGMKIDFGGIAKGYAADQALAILRSKGIRRALVDAGGDLAVGEAPPGQPGWKILVRNPNPAALDKPEYLLLQNTGVATSGDTFQYLEVNGRRYSHIINPANGMGLSDSASTTVIAPDGMTADALATALSVMPVADGLRLVESMKGVSAAIVHRGPAGLQRSLSRGFPKLISHEGQGKAKSTSPRR